MICRIILAAIAASMGAPAPAAEHRVANAAELVRVTPELKPGDTVVLSDGSWKNQEVTIRAVGTENQPISFRAETPGKVIISGQGSVEVDGEYVVVSGLIIHQGEAAKEGIAIRGRHCRVTECAVTDSNYKFYVRLFGSDNRLDRCYFAGKLNDSPTLQVECPAGAPNRHRIDRNHFGPRPPLGRNGGETIRIGYSHQSMNESRATVEDNLFDRCDGELEIISNKSCDNAYRGNTFLECAGMLTLRHGNRCRVEGNFFLGNHKKGSGGIRVIGEDHVIVNNYIDGVMQGGFWVTAGIPNSPLVGYFQAKNCVIAFNTVVDSRGPCIELAAGLGSSGRTLIPEGILVANNVFAPAVGATLVKGTEAAGYRWQGNLCNLQETKFARPTDLKLARSNDGLWRPGADSPCRGAAELIRDHPRWSAEDQARFGWRDVGCDQHSAAPPIRRALTAREVGPSWRSESAESGSP